jgi:hypothetical protein
MIRPIVTLKQILVKIYHIFKKFERTYFKKDSPRIRQNEQMFDYTVYGIRSRFLSMTLQTNSSESPLFFFSVHN